MKHNQNNRRQRSRNNGRRYPNQRGGAFESSGPEVKVRGTAQQVLEKYQALARDAYSSGDRILAEGYLQHAEHYYRIINADGDGNNRDGQRGRNGQGNPDDDGGSGDMNSGHASERNDSAGNVRTDVRGGGRDEESSSDERREAGIADAAPETAQPSGAAAEADGDVEQTKPRKPRSRGPRRAGKPATDPAEQTPVSD